MDWIETKTDLPPRLTDVLIVIDLPGGPSVDTGFVIKDEWYYTGGFQKIGTPVTHWAHMPAPPQTNQERCHA